MELLQTLRTSLLLAFRALPLLLISFVGFLAIGLGNLSLFVLFMGHAFLVPVVTFLVRFLTEFLSKNNTGAYKVISTDITQLVPNAPKDGVLTNVAPSWWMQHVLFFLGYLLANAVSIYRQPPEKGVSELQLENRLAKAKTLIVTTVVMAFALTFLRWNLTGAETPRGIAISVFTGGLLGYGWYQFAALCGARGADVFGVVAQMVPATAKDEKTMTCVYAPQP